MTPVLVSQHDRTQVITLNRPEKRNAISGELLIQLRRALAEAEASSSVNVIVITGADPAFCAGLDMEALGAGDPDLVAEASQPSRRAWPVTSKPVIGAINGAAITGGLELALTCDLLIASERAFFADTHAQVGVMPGWQLTTRLSAAVGRRTAAWMSLTGRPLDAKAAAEAGLVCVVCPHEELVDRALEAAAGIVTTFPEAGGALLNSYRDIEDLVWAPAFEVEAEASRRWRESRPGFGHVADNWRPLLRGNRAAFGEESP